jgi:sec-independent protein translocase protein TatA
MPFSLGPLEIAFFALVLLLLFGGKRLPALGSRIGGGIRGLKHAAGNVTAELRRPTDAALPAESAPAQLPTAQDAGTVVQPARAAPQRDPARPPPGDRPPFRDTTHRPMNLPHAPVPPDSSSSGQGPSGTTTSG